LASPLELNYCPRCGHALEERKAFGRVRRFCPACETVVFREHKVAAGVIVERKGEVLLVRRRMTPRQGLWTFPGGFVDFDESPAEAAARECWEETGLTVEISGLLDVIAGQEHEGGADIVIVYLARPVKGERVEDHLRAADDVDRVAFFSPEGLPPLAFRATREALDNWRTARPGR
jgi:8-oxo-dGTP diphosphatase